MDLPKILLTGLFLFFIFFGFPRVFGQLGLGEQKTSRKTQKKQSCMDLPKILLTGLVFLFFWFFLVFLEFLDIWKAGNRKKGKKTKHAKTQRSQRLFLKKIYTDLSQWQEEDLPRVFIPYLSWSKVYYEPQLAMGEAQNHIFAIVKRSNINFSVLQGYIKSDVEQGYDLSEWLCSRNPFANINGFGKFSLLKLLNHFNTFLENARRGKKFDGENHAAVFLVKEKHFEGSEYLPSFAWFEVEESDIDPSEKIKGMVNKSDEVKFEEQCRDMWKIHQGNLLPGETLQARPGSASSLSSDKPEEWSIPKPVGHEIYAIDNRTSKEKVEEKAEPEEKVEEKAEPEEKVEEKVEPEEKAEEKVEPEEKVEEKAEPEEKAEEKVEPEEKVEDDLEKVVEKMKEQPQKKHEETP